MLAFLATRATRTVPGRARKPIAVATLPTCPALKTPVAIASAPMGGPVSRVTNADLGSTRLTDAAPAPTATKVFRIATSPAPPSIAVAVRRQSPGTPPSAARASAATAGQATLATTAARALLGPTATSASTQARRTRIASRSGAQTNGAAPIAVSAHRSLTPEATAPCAPTVTKGTRTVSSLARVQAATAARLRSLAT